MKQITKRRIVAVLAILMAISMLFSSVAFAKEYEDRYAKNGNIGMRTGEGYEALYEVNNNSGLSQHVIMYFLVQDRFSVDQNDFTYQFEGKFTSDAQYGTHLFEFNLGSPIEYGVLDEVTLGDDKAILHQAQFGIYPGYYNFYNYGSANFTGYSAKAACLIKTLSPNFQLKEDDVEAPELWVEAEEGEDPRIYVIVGESEWIKKVTSDFESWAIEYESKTLGNIVDSGVQEEIVVEVPKENLENLLETAQPSVEIEEVEEEAPIFEENTEIVADEEAHTGLKAMDIVVIAVVVIVIVLGVLGLKAAKKNKY